MNRYYEHPTEKNFRSPVYNVRAVPVEKIVANSYNPNVVAPPEMKLLELSIWEDGFTMPCVCYYDKEADRYILVDGSVPTTTDEEGNTVEPTEEESTAAMEEAKAQADALRQGDFDGFLALVRASGASSAMFLQNVIPTGQTTRQELMVTIALCQALLGGRGAVRVHGGGFGGTAQAFVPLDLVEQFRQETEAALGKGACHVVTIRPAGGIRIG